MEFCRRSGGWSCAVIAVLWSSAVPAVGVDCPSFQTGRQIGTVQLAAIDEASGLVASRKNPGVLWAHNDSGDSARTLAMDTAGNHLGIYNITGASAVDWEDMAVGPGPAEGASYLYLGDIGDNNAVRSSIRVHRVGEPTVSVGQIPGSENLAGSEQITLLYPDGARDAETLLVDPLTADLYVVTKREARSRVYRAAYPQSTTQDVTMTYLGELPWSWATGGDISPDGKEILVRGYFNASLWSRPEGGSIWDAFASAACSVPLVLEPQGEAIGFDAGGAGYLTISEGSNQPIYYFQRPGQPGDANIDGAVDDDDLSLLLANWGQDVTGDIDGGWGRGEFTGTSPVNDDDLSILLANWTGASESFGIPEPAALALLCLGGLGILGLPPRTFIRRSPSKMPTVKCGDNGCARSEA